MLRKVAFISLFLAFSFLAPVQGAFAQSASDDVEVNAKVDRENPTVSITAPPNGSTVSGIVSVTANAADDGGIIKLEFYVDGFLKLTDSSAPYSFSWDTKTAGDGNHTIVVIAYDIVNNTATDSATFTVNNASPSPAVEIPTGQESAQPGQRPPGEGTTRRFFLIDIPSLKLLAPGIAKNSDFLFGILVGIELVIILYLILLIRRFKAPKKSLETSPSQFI